MSIYKVNNNLFIAEESIMAIGEKEVNFLKGELEFSDNKRVRINMHRENNDLLHEMIIAIHKDSYIRPHKHIGKSEAFHIISGIVDVIVFNDEGSIRNIINLSSEKSSNTSFYYRMSEPFFHTLNIKSEVLIVHEITNGPFIKENTIFGEFSPKETETLAIQKWNKRLSEMIEEFIR